MFTCVCRLHQLNPPLGTKLSFFLVHWLLILAEAFRNDHVVACNTALRSPTEKIEMGGYVTVPCSSKMTQRSSTADWLKF